jgi:hypothetical protein
MYGGNATRCKYIEDADKHDGYANTLTWVGNVDIDNSEKVWGRAFRKELTNLPNNSDPAVVKTWIQSKLLAEGCGAPPSVFDCTPILNQLNGRKMISQDEYKSFTANGSISQTNLDKCLKDNGVDVCKDPNAIVDSNGICSCKPGFELFNNRCVAVCQQGEVRDASGNCIPVVKCRFYETQIVYVTGTVYIHTEWPPVGRPQNQTVQNKKGKIIRIDRRVTKCLYVVEFEDGLFAGEITEDQLSDKPPPIKCGPNEVVDSNGNCTCAPGYERNPVTNQCVPVCPSGYYRDNTGNCVPICGPNEILINNKCECKPGYERHPITNQCVPVCPSGYYRDNNTGNCVPKCGPNEILNASNKCDCKPGFVRNHAGQCVVKPIVNCRFTMNQTVYVTGLVYIHTQWPPVNIPQNKIVENKKGKIIRIDSPNDVPSIVEECIYVVKFDDGLYAGEIKEDQLSDTAPPIQPVVQQAPIKTQAPKLTVEGDYYDASDQQFHNFRVTVYVTKNNKDTFIGGGNASRNDRVKDVLTLFKQKCNTCIVTSGKQYVKSLEGTDLYTQFSNLVLKYDHVDLYVIN